MFPIVSLLRRAAAKVVYIEGTEPFVSKSDGVYKVRLSREVDVWNPKAWTWKQAELAPMFMIQTVGESKLLVAKAATAAEDLHAIGMKALETNYTLLLNKETETKTEDGYTRKLRFGVVRGIFRVLNETLVPDESKSS